MKKLILILCLSFIGLAANAQRGGGRSSPEQMIARATEQLDLTEAQVTQWEAIHEKYGDQMREARQNREEAEALRQKIEEEINATLNEEQQIKFAEMKESRPRRGRGRQN